MTAFEFYTQEKQHQENLLQYANRQLNISSFIRLIVFLLVCYGVYYFFAEFRIAAVIALAGIVVFLFLVSRHTDLKYKRDKIKELVNLNELELKILNRDFHDLPTGKEFDNDQHPYSQDIDLFGKGSFFQYLNRTALREGCHKLAHILTENSIDKILEKQEAIKELSAMAKWRQEFTAVAKLVKTETPSNRVLSWLKNYKTFIPGYIKWLPYVFS